MNSEEPDLVDAPETPGAIDPDSAFGRSNVERKSWTGSVDSQSARSMSISKENIDNANDDSTIQHESEPESDDVPSELGSEQDDSASHGAKSSSSRFKDEDLTEWLKEQPKRVNVRWSDYESFTNRYSFEEGKDIIEVLQGDPDQLRAEILHERAKRRHKKHPGLRGKRQAENEGKAIHRVRIQSPAILHILSRLVDDVDGTNARPLTFLRPFQAFYYCHPFVKKVLEVLERGFNDEHSSDGLGTHNGPLERSAELSSIETDDPLQKLSMSSDVDMEDVIYGIPDLNPGAGGQVTAIEHIKLYIDFVEKYIVPMWVEARGSSKPKVRFSDLPMYFRPGDILFERNIAGNNKNKADNTGSNAVRNEALAVHQNYWKLCYAQFEEYPNGAEDTRYMGDKTPAGTRMLRQHFKLDCFHVDFDGDGFGPVGCEITISYYEGEMDIRSLTACPLRFIADAAQTAKELTTRAENFLSYIRERHLSYDGWTLIHETHVQRSNTNDQRTRAEHIEGEVIIDFKEGFQSDSGFIKPTFDTADEPKVTRVTYVDRLLSLDQQNMGVQWWTDTTRSKSKGYSTNFFRVWEPFIARQLSHMKKQDKVLRAFEEDEMVTHFEPEHLLLFPQRLIAYSFRARKFFVANIDNLSFITTPESPFRDLKIESENKRILKSVVGRHFQKQDARRQNKDSILDQDFIRGKGSGLLILLHGVPGVGKTTTAEAVALDNRKPLFALTSGDLGSTPRDVETALRETFRLAAMWDCVLLLDEADLFLAKRDVGDLVRNSLVSVFLRVLDYYDGVLFLTTNRVGTVDEAFRSRIHLALYYPPLRRKQAQEIFKLNIRRTKEIEKSKAALRVKGQDDQSKLPPIEIDEVSILNFATRQWENTRSNPSRRWNGRQIRNSFQVAYSLVNLGQITVPTSHYDDDYDDEEVNYDDEPDIDVTESKDQNSGSTVTSPTATVQAQKPGKLDSSQFEIVERSIRRFDRYLDRTRGPDSDYMKSKNLRRDDFSESGDEDGSHGDHGRYSGARFPPSPHRRTHPRSPASTGYLAPPSDSGGRMQRAAARDAGQRSYGGRRAAVPDDDDDGYADEMPRPRAGGVPGSSPRSRQREYDDEYEYTHHRYN